MPPEDFALVGFFIAAPLAAKATARL